MAVLLVAVGASGWALYSTDRPFRTVQQLQSVEKALQQELNGEINRYLRTTDSTALAGADQILQRVVNELNGASPI